MLPAQHRMRRAEHFSAAVRRGARGGSRRVVVHLHLPADPEDAPARAGLVVPRAVGTAVRRNQVKRRLRALLVPRVAQLPHGALLVVRALPASAGATSADLAADLGVATAKARSHGARRSPASRGRPAGAR
ncbi:ribonuclease P protein component [Georgenia sp. 10Sc9-8]|uniref:Ribonuclease P protein component n=1 Tax=Georgenia halotolerans TaxID=3028317 RepID=A0ABT5TYS5_9MICO|nr:ribonuclease P protein component [Georgenia halotolerans]